MPDVSTANIEQLLHDSRDSVDYPPTPDIAGRVLERLQPATPDHQAQVGRIATPPRRVTSGALIGWHTWRRTLDASYRCVRNPSGQENVTVDINDSSNDSGDAPVSLRSGMTVRVTNPNSPHYGATGHLLGRNEQREPYWLVRITTTPAPVHLLDEEMIVVR